MLWITRQTVVIAILSLLLLTACNVPRSTGTAVEIRITYAVTRNPVASSELTATDVQQNGTPASHAASVTPLPELVETRETLSLWTSTPNVDSSLQHTPTPSITSSIGAIQLLQSIYPEVSGFRLVLTPGPFENQRIQIFEGDDHWVIVFVHGEGDCQVGCLSHYYWYYSVWPDGRTTREGYFRREFHAPTNSYIESGTPMWGVPR